MEKLVMKNWGFFLNELEDMYEELRSARKDERDPYKQLALDAKIEVVNNCMRRYREYINDIWDDNGQKFNVYLSNNLLDVTKKLRREKQAYMIVVHNEVIGLYTKLMKRFKEFIPEQR